MNKCNNCKEPIKHHWILCPVCLDRISPYHVCNKCNSKLKAHWKICPECNFPTGSIQLQNPYLICSLTDKRINKQTPYSSNFKLPPFHLLGKNYDDLYYIESNEVEENTNNIIKTLNYYSISVLKVKATIGPAITLYEIEPAPGTRLSRIKNLEDDISLSLSELGVRIITPIPGKGTVGIEVPNRQPLTVPLGSVLHSDEFKECEYELPIVIGKTVDNKNFIVDLTRLPHLLIAGATGQGKTTAINGFISSLLFKKRPEELKLIIIDPKKVELRMYSKIADHYCAKLPDSDESIISDTSEAIKALESLNQELDNRYELLKKAEARNVREYNKRFKNGKLKQNHRHRFLPYLILVIDEFADLIMTAGKEFENPLNRLAQLAKAVGIHIIIATRRPSINIITGTIKANFITRIAFRVISRIDSRTILDASGADQLIGGGDMLFSNDHETKRLQGAYIDISEIERITNYISAQPSFQTEYQLPENVLINQKAEKEFFYKRKDDLFMKAAKIVVKYQKGSTSLLQNKLKIGYNRAGKIIDELETAGIVGPFEGSMKREVKIPNKSALYNFLKKSGDI